jgi:N-acyl-phosphatidylethanolamine-hydrolysing phospholipase D
MAPQHCNPAEAVAIHRDVGAGVSVAMHWGTWQLTDEAREDPPRALAEARTAAGLPADAIRVMSPGETLAL